MTFGRCLKSYYVCVQYVVEVTQQHSDACQRDCVEHPKPISHPTQIYIPPPFTVLYRVSVRAAAIIYV